ncbi:hypothetical protein E6O75_ATG09091 [Venturia nashicola]|uniref:Uncharacterized protein n=1 Tax=Venturia nashicola TaxID=86259 RepID=A0A4Z1NMT8_9PEZI|nr:hypothetical protein E6O75_ATG09091 [Venturia nashicola]
MADCCTSSLGLDDDYFLRDLTTQKPLTSKRNSYGYRTGSLCSTPSTSLSFRGRFEGLDDDYFLRDFTTQKPLTFKRNSDGVQHRHPVSYSYSNPYQQQYQPVSNENWSVSPASATLLPVLRKSVPASVPTHIQRKFIHLPNFSHSTADPGERKSCSAQQSSKDVNAPPNTSNQASRQHTSPSKQPASPAIRQIWMTAKQQIPQMNNNACGYSRLNIKIKDIPTAIQTIQASRPFPSTQDLRHRDGWI